MLYSCSIFYLRRSILVHRSMVTLYRLLTWRLSAPSIYSLILLVFTSYFLLQLSFHFFRFRLLLHMCPKKTFNYLSFLDSPNSIWQLLFIHTLSISLTLHISLSATLSLSLLFSSSHCLSLSLPSSLSLRHSSPPSPANRSSMLLLLPNDVEMTSFFWLCRSPSLPSSLSLALCVSITSASWQFVNTNMLQTCSQVFVRGERGEKTIAC